MTPVVTIVGRPNVGKSTLFNRLTRSRSALVADLPGLTRDRHYGRGQVGEKSYIVVDTGGLEPQAEDGIFHAMAQQTMRAIDESDAIVFLVDGRAGLTAQDRAVASHLRKTGRPLWLVVNKTEGMLLSAATADFHELGMGEPLAIAAAHGDGVSDLADLITEDFPARAEEPQTPANGERHPRIAVVGRPNVGKSTLVNRVLGEDRLLVFDQPGTTRDSIEVDFVRDGKTYTLVDTAGIRRRGQVFEAVEKFSVVKTLQAIESANLVILVLDARDPISDQDAHIAAYILDAGRALVIAVNKWDELNAHQRESAKRSLARTLNFMEFAAVHYISALTGRGVRGMFQSVDIAYRAAMIKLSTPKLTRALIAAASAQPPPRAGASRPKLRYAHQGGSNPPRIVIHGSAISHISASYRRYLERFFREAFQLKGTPIKIELRQGRNPYITKERSWPRRAKD